MAGRRAWSPWALTAVIFAASNVNMALNDFTSQLSEEQKTKLNSLVR